MTTIRPFTRLFTLGLLALLALVALLWPPGPYRAAQAAPSADDEPTYTLFLPVISTGKAPPDLIFSPETVELAPGASASVAVRVEPAADLRGATFELPGVQDGVTSSFEAAADGATGTLTIEASEASEAGERPLTVQGKSGVDSSKTWTGALSVKTSSKSSAKTLVVDAKNGNDSNDGSQAKPFKTLKKALSVAKSGDTVKLLAGTYGSGGSGDTYPLQVPNGVTVAGTLASNGAKQTFLSTTGGSADDLALTFAGDATVKDLEIDVFDTAIQASKDKLTLSNLNFIQNKLSVDLKGTAQATLISADVFMASGNIGAILFDQAKMTMDGGKIQGTGSCASENGMKLNDAAQVTLKNGATLENIHGTALSLNNSSKATLDSVTIRQTNPATCGSIGINAESTSGAPNNVTLTMNNTNITGHKDSGIRLTGNEKVTVKGGSISSNGTGIEAFTSNRPTITITGASLNKNKIGIEVIDPILRVRKSSVTQNEKGIVVHGQVGIIGGPQVDLGTDPSMFGGAADDPGGNDFSGNTNSGVAIQPQSQAPTAVFAAGNTWNANTQGTDSSGHYTRHFVVDGSSSLAQGSKNFIVPFVATKLLL